MSKESELKEAGLEPCPNPWCRALLKPSVEECESGVYISCCVDGPPRMSYADAIAAWNTRAQDTVPRAVAVELLRVLEFNWVDCGPEKNCCECDMKRTAIARAKEAGIE